jgi:hypothetical protein
MHGRVVKQAALVKQAVQRVPARPHLPHILCRHVLPHAYHVLGLFLLLVWAEDADTDRIDSANGHTRNHMIIALIIWQKLSQFCEGASLVSALGSAAS